MADSVENQNALLNQRIKDIVSQGITITIEEDEDSVAQVELTKKSDPGFMATMDLEEFNTLENVLESFETGL